MVTLENERGWTMISALSQWENWLMVNRDTVTFVMIGGGILLGCVVIGLILAKKNSDK